MRLSKIPIFNIVLVLASLGCILSWTWYYSPESVRWLFPKPSPEELKAAEEKAKSEYLIYQLPSPIADLELVLQSAEKKTVVTFPTLEILQSSDKKTVVRFPALEIGKQLEKETLKEAFRSQSLVLQLGMARKVPADPAWKSIGEALIYKEKGGTPVTVKVYETAKGLGFQFNGMDYASESVQKELMDFIHEKQKTAGSP